MSARFFKIFVIVFLFHILGFSLLWIGFPVPHQRPGAIFFYEGPLPVSGEGAHAASAAWEKQKSAPMDIDYFQPAGFNHWIELRGLSKP